MIISTANQRVHVVQHTRLCMSVTIRYCSNQHSIVYVHLSTLSFPNCSGWGKHLIQVVQVLVVGDVHSQADLSIYTVPTEETQHVDQDDTTKSGQNKSEKVTQLHLSGLWPSSVLTIWQLCTYGAWVPVKGRWWHCG